MRRVLTQVSALDGAVAEGDAEVVTRLPQLRDGDAVGAADYPRLVVILPFWAGARTGERACRPDGAGGERRRRKDAISDAASPVHSEGKREGRREGQREERGAGGRAGGDDTDVRHREGGGREGVGRVRG